jgi:hypothetical protein
LHGNVIRSKINNSCAKVTITLVKSSKSNKVLSKYLQLDQLNNSGAFSIAIKDACSNDLFASDSGYITRIPNMSITKTPNIEYGEEVKTVEWEIMATQVVQNIGYIF